MKLFLDARIKFDLDVSGNDPDVVATIARQMRLLKSTMDYLERTIERGISEDAGSVESDWSSSVPQEVDEIV